jgi:hypothetical protein
MQDLRLWHLQADRYGERGGLYRDVRHDLLDGSRGRQSRQERLHVEDRHLERWLCRARDVGWAQAMGRRRKLCRHFQGEDRFGDATCDDTKLDVPQLYNANCGPPVPDDVTLTPDAEDFRLKCFAM